MNIKNTIFLFAAFVVIAAFNPEAAFANTVKGTSAYLSGPQAANMQIAQRDNRAEILKTYLEQYDSPLAANAQTFIDEADKHNLDWKLVAAIAGVESYYGHMIPPYSFNGWGYGVYGNNVRRFASWDEGIATVSEAIRTDYLYDNPETDVYLIGRKYASDTRWAIKVTNFMNSIEAYAQRAAKPSVSLSL